MNPPKTQKLYIDLHRYSILTKGIYTSHDKIGPIKFVSLEDFF